MVEEGKMAAIVLRRCQSWFGMVALQGAMGKLGVATVSTASLTQLRVTPSSRFVRRLKVATDGEITWMNTPIEFRVAPEPLLLLTPIDAVPETAST